jgi:crossover junction endodeoxyribonuclease RusA
MRRTRSPAPLHRPAPPPAAAPPPVADTPMLDVFVPGRPAPQGSKRNLGNRRMVESCEGVASWRVDVRASVLAAMQATGHSGFRARVPVAVRLEFVLPRPAATPKRRTPPAVKRPDVDKLARAVLDALTSAGAVADDSQVVDLHPVKRLAEVDETPGCRITVAVYGTQSDAPPLSGTTTLGEPESA